MAINNLLLLNSSEMPRCGNTVSSLFQDERDFTHHDDHITSKYVTPGSKPLSTIIIIIIILIGMRKIENLRNESWH